MPSALRLSIDPYEILLPGRTLELLTETPLNEEVVRDGFFVKDHVGAVHVVRTGRRARWDPEPPLPPGRHTAIVSQQWDRDGEELGEPAEVPFFVCDSRSRVPSTWRIEHLVRLRVGKLGTTRLSPFARPPGRFLEILKATHRRTDESRIFAFDEKGEKVDARRILKEVDRNREKKYGKLHPTLWERLRSAGPEDRLLVAAWLADLEPPLTPAHLLGRGELPLEVERYRKSVAKARETFSAWLERDLGVRQVTASTAAPVVYAVLRPDEVRTVAKSEMVERLFLHEPVFREDIATSVAIANSDDAHTSGFTGMGVKVGVWELTPDAQDLDIEAYYTVEVLGFPLFLVPKSEHASYVHAIIKNTKNGGHAPGCKLYAADWTGLDLSLILNDLAALTVPDMTALDWAVKQKKCSVVNQSFHHVEGAKEGTLNLVDVHKDHLAKDYGTTFVSAAGNKGPDDEKPTDGNGEFVNHKNFNGLSVGNHKDDASAISGLSVHRNPDSPHGDRELPEIAANGMGVTWSGPAKSGTSFAAPAVAGAVAVVQQIHTDLLKSPEGCRAILLAGALRNVSGDSWWKDIVAGIDGKDGAGALDTHRSVLIAQHRRSPTSAPSGGGWDIQDLKKGDPNFLGYLPQTYRVKAGPVFAFGPGHAMIKGPWWRVRVALAWMSRVKGDNFSVLDWNLDLKIVDETTNFQIAHSSSFDNNYEIVEFSAWPGRVYKIRIQQFGAEPEKNTRFGVAWTSWAQWPKVIPFLKEDSIADLAGAGALGP